MGKQGREGSEDVMKHPGPWKPLGGTGYIVDANNELVCHVSDSDDPETRAILTHAAEMWEALRSNMSDINDEGDALIRKIEREIAAEKGDGT